MLPGRAWLAIPILAAAMVVLTFTPGQVWHHPTNDAVYTGFDPNLMYATGGDGGSVHFDSGSIRLTARPHSQPSVNFLTTPLDKANASIDVSLSQNSGTTEPLRIGVWSPWSRSGEFIRFGPAPANEVAAETITNGPPSTTLLYGDVSRSTVLGHYQLGHRYHLSFDIDKSQRSIRTTISGDDGLQGVGLLTPTESPGIFDRIQLSLTASADAGAGTSDVQLTGYKLTVPHQRVWVDKISDPRATAMLIVLGIIGAVALAGAVVIQLAGLRRRRALTSPRRLHVNPWIVAAVGIYLIGNGLLFPLGGHPFDMGDEKLYAYTAHVYGMPQLFFLPNFVSLAAVWGGVPYGEYAFPYEPVVAYLSNTIGWADSILFSGGGAFPLDSTPLEYLIKAVNVAFGLVDSALIYLILKGIGVSERWSLIAAALFMFNPAVWFSQSVWGQTHVFSLFFVLLAVYFAESHLPTLAWFALVLGCLTRPQMLVFALLLPIVFFRKFSWRENLMAVSWTAIAAFVVILPLTLATSPSLPVDIMLHNVTVQQGGGNNQAVTTVSQDAYSIWPLVTYAVSGASGLGRAFTLSSTSLIGPLTYQRFSQVLTLTALLVICGVLLVRKRTTSEPGAYLPFVALGITSFLMLFTGVVATHFLLALPFLLLSYRSMGRVAYLYVVAIWTLTTLVPMYGDMGVVIANHGYPLLAPEHNPLTKFVINLYSSDRFITVATVANVCALIWLAYLAARPTTRPAQATA